MFATVDGLLELGLLELRDEFMVSGALLGANLDLS